MSTKIYKNQYGHEINENQIDYTEIYYKEIHESGIKKIVEHISENETTHISYYLSTTETIAAVLLQFSNKKITFVSTSFSNTYKVEEQFYYENSNLLMKSKNILDSNGNAICFQKLDIVTNSPILGSTEKIFINANGSRKYFFDYNDDGTCFIINDYELDEQILPSTIGQPNIDFTWVGFEYYQNALPIIPL